MFDKRAGGRNNGKECVGALPPQVKPHKAGRVCKSFEVKAIIIQQLEENQYCRWCSPAANDFSQSRLNDLERRATEMNPPMSKLEVTGLGSNL